ncbi:ABC transporter ATP-binding protein [Dactylosporangium sp. NPDC050688]|uniref:ABC transporter ATP-binding protein n=1 Tax=Dactylosporangium sp. NPDC050688 TaxID=3157217 RepID=UPI0033E132FC
MITVMGRVGAALALAWRARPALLAGYVAARLLAGALPAVAAWLTKVAIDRVVAGGASEAVLPVAGALAAAGLLAALGPPVMRYTQAELGRAVAVVAKDRLYAAVGRFTLLRTLEDPAFRDRLRLAEQAGNGGPGQVVDSVLGVAQSVVTLAGMAGALVVVSPWLAAGLVAAAVPALVAELRLSRRRAALTYTLSPAERRELFYSDLLTDLSAAKEIRLFGAGPLLRHRMLAELRTVNAGHRRLDRTELGSQVGLAALSALLAGAAVIWTLVAAAGGSLSAGDVGAVILAVAGVQAALSGGVQYLALAHHAGLLFDHYRELLATPPDATAAPGSAPRDEERGIVLDDVWFRYGDDQPWVLQGVTAAIPPGSAVALVGENGSGKSTLVKLLCRFYDPTRGAIRWDGTDLRDLPADELRRRIAAVFQDFMSYELTAAENIALGDTDGRTALDTDPARLADPARQAGIHDTLLDLPGGYDTLLSRTFVDYDRPDGVLLSGGQWQRLALARALLRGRRDLLILDEPSSGLDAEAEHRIHRAITAHRAGRTSVLISHRLNTVRDADRILVLAGGRITETGTHDELMAAGGRYAGLFRLQASGYHLDPAA